MDRRRNRLPEKPGGIALTHLLNRRCAIEIELTVVRLAEDRFYLVCAAFFEQRLLDHLALHRGDEGMQVVNRSDDWAALSLNGPGRAISCLRALMLHWTMPVSAGCRRVK